MHTLGEVRMPPAPSARGLQSLAYALHLFVVGEAGQGRLEKEEAQHGKHDEELDENDAPQGAPPRHLPKSVAIEAPDAAQTCGDVFHIVWFLFQQFVKFCCSGWNILLYNITVPVNK